MEEFVFCSFEGWGEKIRGEGKRGEEARGCEAGDYTNGCDQNMFPRGAEWLKDF